MDNKESLSKNDIMEMTAIAAAIMSEEMILDDIITRVTELKHALNNKATTPEALSRARHGAAICCSLLMMKVMNGDSMGKTVDMIKRMQEHENVREQIKVAKIN